VKKGQINFHRGQCNLAHEKGSDQFSPAANAILVESSEIDLTLFRKLI